MPAPAASVSYHCPKGCLLDGFAMLLMIGLFIGGIILVNQPRVLQLLPDPESIWFELGMFAIIAGPLLIVWVIWMGPKLVIESSEARWREANAGWHRRHRLAEMQRRYGRTELTDAYDLLDWLLFDHRARLHVRTGLLPAPYAGLSGPTYNLLLPFDEIECGIFVIRDDLVRPWPDHDGWVVVGEGIDELICIEPSTGRARYDWSDEPHPSLVHLLASYVKSDSPDRD